MKLKDKLKTFGIAVATAFITSCGFKTEQPQLEERNANNIANGLPHEKMGRFTTLEDYYSSNWQVIAKGDSASIEILNELKKAKIPVTKGDSILHDIEAKEVDGKYEFSNPHYALNKVERDVMPDNTEHVDGVVISRKINPDDIKKGTFKADEKTIGVKSFNEFEVEKEISRVRKLVEDREVEKTLHKGDTVKIPGGYFSKEKVAVVEKDGVSPTTTDSYTLVDNAMKIVFDYNLKRE